MDGAERSQALHGWQTPQTGGRAEVGTLQWEARVLGQNELILEKSTLLSTHQQCAC